MDIITIQVFSLFCMEITIFFLKLGPISPNFRQTALFFKKSEYLWACIMSLGRKVKN